MKVPPRSTAPRETATMPAFVEATLERTPTASTSAAAAKARAVPMRWPMRFHSQTDGAAPRPTMTQMIGSRLGTSARTRATRKVAVIT
jgi:hypothetical protein